MGPLLEEGKPRLLYLVCSCPANSSSAALPESVRVRLMERNFLNGILWEGEREEGGEDGGRERYRGREREGDIARENLLENSFEMVSQP